MTRGPVGPKRWLGSKAKRISKGCRNSSGAFTPFQSNADSAATPIWAGSRNRPHFPCPAKPWRRRMLDENHRRRPQICAGQGVSEEEALKKGTHRLRTVALIVAGGLVLALVGTVLLKLLAPMPRKAGVRANRELSIL